VGFVVTWLLLAALWVGLSGFFDPVHLTFGAVSVTLVTLFTHRRFMPSAAVSGALARMGRLVLYVPWLVWQIAVANVDVMQRIFGMRPIDPVVIRFTPDLVSEFGRVTLANSITLTPGTVTVDITDEGEFVVHALNREAADAVLTRAMELKVKAVEGGASSG
jgi:multicomponent Na+:H+ antiporter subunit E